MTDPEGPTAHQIHPERRRPTAADQSPIGILQQMPALVVLDRIPVSVLAVDDDGSIVFANRTFGDMVGMSPADMTGTPFRNLLRRPDQGPVSGADFASFAGSVVEFRHAEDWYVEAKMSESALLRGDDAGYLVAFEDITELSWERRAAD